tara:strand:+ start:53 stop:466 length:414 start_codon:yes stop_codon:yes gene_type:complete
MYDLYGNKIPEKMTGKKFEKLVAQILRKNGCLVTEQADIGFKFKNKKHQVDSLVNGKILVSVKWQDTGGTAEEKVGYEMFTLHQKILSGTYEKAFVILGGPGWTIIENLLKMSKLFPKVTLIRYEDDETLSFIKDEI